MPLYDYECPHHHRFEHFTSISEQDAPIKCMVEVNQLVMDDQLVDKYTDGLEPLPADLAWQDLPAVEGAKTGKILVRKVPCALQARQIIGQHNNPGGAILHNAAANRDAAREGRYDPANPSLRFVSKGRQWRK